MKKSKKTGDVAIAESNATETAVTSPVTEPTVTVTEKVIGRPVNPNSARQKRLAEIEARKAAHGGFLPLGRPKVEGSKRQAKLAEIAAKKAAGYEPKLGRPKMTEEQKAEAKAKRAEAMEVFLKNQQALSLEGNK